MTLYRELSVTLCTSETQKKKKKSLKANECSIMKSLFQGDLVSQKLWNLMKNICLFF